MNKILLINFESNIELPKNEKVDIQKNQRIKNAQ